MSARALRRLPPALTITAFAGAMLWAGWLGWLHLVGRSTVLDRAESVLADNRLLAAGNMAPPKRVVIVAIDDAFVSAEGGYPIERQRLAELVRAIGRAKPRALAIDMLFVDGREASGDRALAAAFSAIPTVIAAAGRFDGKSNGAGYVPRTDGELWPLPVFAGAASVGLVNIAKDAGGTPRHLPLVLQTTRGLMPSLVLRAVGLFTGVDPVITGGGVRIDGQDRRLDLGWYLPLRYYGPAGSIKTIPAGRLLSGPAPNGDLTGRLVILGVTATAIGDTFSTPFDRVLPGVEVLATGIANLLDGSQLIRDHAVRRADVAATLALAACGILSVAFLPLTPGLVLFLVLLVGWLMATAVLLAHGYWMSAALPLAGALPPVAVLVFVRQVLERHRSRRLETVGEALRRFQAPALAGRIEEDPAFLSEPREQPAAILFVDLSGFTGLSEQFGPARTQTLLKTFHTLVEEAVASENGLVLNYMGDGAMIAFGIPDPAPDDAARALRTAVALVRGVRRWIERADIGGMIADARVGAHFGPVVLSRLGHEHHQHITTTGDTVNVASRLMEVAKENGAVLAVSSELLAMAGADTAMRAPDTTKTVAIRGRRQTAVVSLWRAAWDAAGP